MHIDEDNYYAVLKWKHENLFRAVYRVEDLIIEGKHDRDKLIALMNRLKKRIYDNYLVVTEWNHKVHGYNILDIGHLN